MDTPGETVPHDGHTLKFLTGRTVMMVLSASQNALSTTALVWHKSHREGLRIRYPRNLGTMRAVTAASLLLGG
jgi:hypothetical protein